MSNSKLQADQPLTDRPKPSGLTGTDSPVLHRSARKDSISRLESEAESELSDRPPVEMFVEEGELPDDQDITVTDQDQSISEEQTFRETMRGICSFMGWSHIPHINSSSNPSDDNPFAGPKAPVPSKVLVQMPTEDWLCRKLSKLNITLVEGYPSHSSDAGGQLKDQFLRPAKSQSKWYGLFSDQKVDPSVVSSWSMDACKLNSSYSRIARQAGLSSTPPAYHHISQETMH